MMGKRNGDFSEKAMVGGKELYVYCGSKLLIKICFLSG
jgi:hypothetical protein